MPLISFNEWFGRWQRSGVTVGFRGGLALTRDKPGLDYPIVDIPMSDELVFPLLGYGARVAEPVVVVGQHVFRGEHLADGVLASAAGTVTAIETRAIAHPSGRPATCLILTTDADGVTEAASTGVGTVGGIDEDAHARRGTPLPPMPTLTVDRLEEAGIGGLGGAGYMLHEKLRSLAQPVHTLVVNAAECEPGLSCDEALMQIDADGIVEGCRALATLIGCTRTVLVIEADKHGAVVAMTAAIEATQSAIEITTVEPIYPSGAERLTVQLATGTRLGATERPTDRGILCINVATALAAARARLGEPQTSRIVTVGGALARAPCNVRVPFGTPIAHILAATNQYSEPDSDGNSPRLRVGGPLSGFDITDAAVPVTATLNRIALEPRLDLRQSHPCIRCAACSDVCPVDLLPQELLRHARANAERSLDRHGLDACLECGCCDVVCPSAIPLTATFRHARAERRDARRRRSDADIAEVRYRLREERLSRPVEAAADPVAAALARVRGKRRSSRPSTGRARDNADAPIDSDAGRRSR